MRMPVATLILLSLWSCEDEKPPNAPPELPAKVDDAAVARVPKVAPDASVPDLGSPATPALQQLAGRWSGEGESKSLGAVRGEFVVDEAGVVFAKVSGSQVSRSDNLQIVSWDGNTLTLSHPDVDKVALEAKLEGNALILRVPHEGEFTLTRDAKKK